MDKWTDEKTQQEYLILLESDTLSKAAIPETVTKAKELVSEYRATLDDVVQPFWELETGEELQLQAKGTGTVWSVPATEANEKAYSRLKSKAVKYEAIVLAHLGRQLL